MTHSQQIIHQKQCQFRIEDAYRATILTDHPEIIDQAIEAFRFYCGHIHIFIYHGTIYRQFPPAKEIHLALQDIQVSQFYISEAKQQALENTIHDLQDIRIPVCYLDHQYVALDGHTRLKLLEKHHIQQAVCYLDQAFDGLEDFVRMAKERQITNVYTMPVISASDYQHLWLDFCQDWYQKRKEETIWQN